MNKDNKHPHGQNLIRFRFVLFTDDDGTKKYSIIPHKNIKVVERTGAGDAFASGFVAGMILGRNMQKCLELGLKESESVLGHFGAKNNLLKIKMLR